MPNVKFKFQQVGRNNNILSLPQSQLECLALRIFNLHSTKKAVLSLLTRFSKRYNGIVFPSQSYIGSLLGISREWVCKLIGVLEELELLTSYQRFNSSNIYTLPAIFNDDRFKQLVYKFLPAIGLPISLLLGGSDVVHTTIELRSNLNRTVSYVPTTICKRELKMSDFSPVVDNFNLINVTLRGKIELSGWPDAAIKDAISKYKHSAAIRNPFSVFMFKCNNFCVSNGLRYDYKRRNELIAKHGISEDASMFEYSNAANAATEQSKEKPKFSGEGIKPVGHFQTQQQKYEKLRDEISAGIWRGREKQAQLELNLLKAKAEYEAKPKRTTPINFVDEYRKALQYVADGKFVSNPYITTERILEIIKSKATAYAIENQLDFPEGGIIFTISAVDDYSKVTSEDKALIFNNFQQQLQKALASPAMEVIEGGGAPPSDDDAPEQTELTWT